MEVRLLGDEQQVHEAPLGSERSHRTELLVMLSLHKTWGDLKVLDDVELVLDAGTTTWIGGANGVGKTTLLRIAAGLICPDEGVVDLDGLHPRLDRARYQARVGFLSAGDRGLYARLNVRQHLELWARLSLLSRASRCATIERTIEQLELQELVDSRLDRLSMGQRQRVRIAMAFLHEPDLVLLDEPLSSLDERSAGLLRACLSDVARRGGAALWVSPTPPEEAVFDRLLWLEGGRLVPRGRR
jgi:ABC-2 type transport system ATP-binding protein